MHVCAIPPQPITSANGPLRPASSPGWRRWQPSNRHKSKLPVFLDKALPTGHDEQMARPASPVTIMQTPPEDGKSASISSSVEETQIEIKSYVEEVSELEVKPLLGHDKNLSRRSTGSSLRKRSLKVRHRLRHLLRLQDNRDDSEDPESGAPTELSKKASKAQKTKEKASETEGGGPMNDITYHIATGLCWYMPAPFDMMPPGYPVRLF
ncbi:hypothetical protein CDEST_13773 [Colletotrichum destructivum]|uniref:Uncharacterized protein n=1 Tax=Colletotrichum destructivum TaxID=34406 RepID=A0AAX4IZW2_9PEZI|nr:hypothetical protein CDEST_13773 [Colletotrichum destructivum]